MTALKKAAKKEVMREEIKNAKKTMKKNMEGYKGGEFKALKKKLKDEPWKETLLVVAELQQKMHKTAEEGAGGEKQKQQAVDLCAFAELQLEGTKVIVDSESAGKRYFGCRAVIKTVEGDEALLDFDTKGIDSLPLKMVAAESGFGDLKNQKRIKGFNAVTRTDLKSIMRWCGYMLRGECEGDVVQNEAKQGTMIYSLNLAAGFRLMQMNLDMKDEDLEFVHPDLWKTYMESRKGPAEGADEACVEELMQGQVNRTQLLKKKLGMKKVVVMPVHFKDHWTLVVVDGRGSGEQVLRYMDSLRSEEFVLEVWTHANEGLKELMGWSLPKRWNEGRQPFGSTVCGAYCLHYMEQCCRAMLLQEPWSSLGWPSSEVWGERLMKLAGLMKKEQEKTKKDHEKEEEKKKKKQEEQEKKKADNKKKAGKVDAEMKALADEADASIKKIPAGKPCLENLSAKAQEAVALAAAGGGICSRCRWSAGCLSCHEEKALQYWLKKEGFVVETMEMAWDNWLMES